MEPTTAKLFWQINSMVDRAQLTTWVKDVVVPIEESKYKKSSDTDDTSKVGKM